MGTGILPIPFGDLATPANLDGDLSGLLGEEFIVGSKTYRAVAANAAFTAPEGLSWEYVDQDDFKVTPTPTSNPKRVEGVSSFTQKALAEGDVFLIQTKGLASMEADDTTLAVGDYVKPASSTAGRASDSGTSWVSGDFAQVVTAKTAGSMTAGDEVVVRLLLEQQEK